ncbi:MAG: hypothetical protein ACKVUS_20370 [Saprospiraceae bacterium]
MTTERGCSVAYTETCSVAYTETCSVAYTEDVFRGVFRGVHSFLRNDNRARVFRGVHRDVLRGVFPHAAVNPAAKAAGTSTCAATLIF